MPELPDVTAYVESLRRRVVGSALTNVHIKSPFFLRTATPPLAQAVGRKVCEVSRLGKRIVLTMEGELSIVIHLMIAGRLHWKERASSSLPRNALMRFDFEAGKLIVTEASTHHRASLHVVGTREELEAFRPAGVEIFEVDPKGFEEALRAENHTLKRALTDQRIVSGIGNAYSDEILFHAGISPLRLTQALSSEEIAALHASAQEVLGSWVDRLMAEAQERFPEKVTAFRPEMAVHGRYKEPCKTCGAPIQRIRFGERECNYCARCQNQGRLLADRSLSRLMKKDWPKTLEDLERLYKPGGGS